MVVQQCLLGVESQEYGIKLSLERVGCYDLGHIWGLLYRSISEQFPVRRFDPERHPANVKIVMVMVMVNRL